METKELRELEGQELIEALRSSNLLAFRLVKGNEVKEVYDNDEGDDYYYIVTNDKHVEQTVFYENTLEDILEYIADGYHVTDVQNYESFSAFIFTALPEESEYPEELEKLQAEYPEKGQLDSVKEVVANVYTDGEGCSYNSIIWK